MISREWLEEKGNVVNGLLSAIEEEQDPETQLYLIGRARSEVEEAQAAVASALRPAARSKFGAALESVLREARPAVRRKAIRFLDEAFGSSGRGFAQRRKGAERDAGRGRNRTSGTGRTSQTGDGSQPIVGAQGRSGSCGEEVGAA